MRSRRLYCMQKTTNKKLKEEHSYCYFRFGFVSSVWISARSDRERKAKCALELFIASFACGSVTLSLHIMHTYFFVCSGLRHFFFVAVVELLLVSNALHSLDCLLSLSRSVFSSTFCAVCYCFVCFVWFCFVGRINSEKKEPNLQI